MAFYQLKTVRQCHIPYFRTSIITKKGEENWVKKSSVPLRLAGQVCAEEGLTKQ